MMTMQFEYRHQIFDHENIDLQSFSLAILFSKVLPKATSVEHLTKFSPVVTHPELSGDINTLTVHNTGGCKLLYSSGHHDRSRW